MLSRGYSGSMPEMGEVHATTRQWLTASILPIVALPICAIAWVQQA